MDHAEADPCIKKMHQARQARIRMFNIWVGESTHTHTIKTKLTNVKIDGWAYHMQICAWLTVAKANNAKIQYFIISLVKNIKDITDWTRMRCETNRQKD